MTMTMTRQAQRTSRLPLFSVSAAYVQSWAHFWQVWWARTAGVAAIDSTRLDRFATLGRILPANASPVYSKADARHSLLRRAIISPASLPGSACVGQVRGSQRADFPSWSRWIA